MKLADMLHYVGLLLLFTFTIFGGFLLKGDSWSLVFFGSGLVLVFIVYYLVKLMTEKKQETHPNLVHKVVLWGVYIVIAFFGGVISLHFITVQFIANDDLKNNGKERLDAIIQMRTAFNDSEKKIKKDLQMDVNECLNAYLDAPKRSQAKKDKRDTLINMYKFSSEALEDLRHKNINTRAGTWVEKHYTNQIKLFKGPVYKTLMDNHYNLNKNIFNNINPISKNQIYYGLDSIVNTNKDKLENGFSEVITKYNKSADIFSSFTIPPTTVELNSLSGLRKQYSPLKYIGFYLLLHLCILLPILLTKKTGQAPQSEEDQADEL